MESMSMSMSMSMPASSTMDMASMSGMPSSTASAMPGMSHGSHGGSSMMMGMSDMKMTFFTATDTPLYSDAWTPSSTGAYVGTCIFLIALAVLFRGIIAVRCNFLVLWARFSQMRHGGILEYEREDRFVKQKPRPWRINEAAARAVLDTVLAGVSYLL